MSWSPSEGPRRAAPDPPPPKLQPSPPHLGSHVLLGRCGPRGRLRALCEVLGLRRECAARGQCRGPAGGRGPGGGVGLSESGCRGGRSPRRPAPGGRGAWGGRVRSAGSEPRASVLVCDVCGDRGWARYLGCLAGAVLGWVCTQALLCCCCGVCVWEGVCLPRLEGEANAPRCWQSDLVGGCVCPGVSVVRVSGDYPPTSGL